MRLFGVCAGLVSVGLSIWGSAVSCTADGSSELSSGSSSEGSGNSGTGANSGQGGFSNTGGGDTGGVEECFGVDAEATPALEAADVIFAIDTSGSMGDESGFVNEKMNAFSQQIISSGVDVRVVMLAEPPPPIPPFPFPITPPGVCIAAPLGSGNCPADENPPHYYHPASEIGSSDSLQVIYDLFPSYEAVLRENANTYLVIITDDNFAPGGGTSPILDAQDFQTRWTALAPNKLTGFIAHAIYCFNSSGDCVTKGQVYEDLVNLTTGGIHGDLAQQDFQPIFDAVADQIVVNAGQLPCEYLIPDPPENELLDPGKVNVIFTDGSDVANDIFKVDGVDGCDPVDGGWYYDNPQNPVKIILCPASCDVVSGDEDGKMNIEFGCATKLPPPE